MNDENYNFDLCETEDSYDPLHDAEREQLFNDPFWNFSNLTIADLARQANPPSLPDLY